MHNDSRRDVMKAAGGLVVMGNFLTASTADAQTATPATSSSAPDRIWTNHEATRWAWQPLRSIDAGSDPAEFVDDAERLNINMLFVTAAGLVAFYPSKVKYHEPSPYLPKGRDFYGEMARRAKQKGMRVGARVDFSRAPEQAFIDHPDWFFRLPDGRPVVDETKRYQPCINGGWYLGHAPTIVQELLTRYEVSGIFFNNFVNNPRNWGLNEVCHCQSCSTKYRARFGEALPEKVNPKYDAFIADCVHEAAALYRNVVMAAAPGCLYLNDSEPTDGRHSETRATVFPGQIWPYSASAVCNLLRNSAPDRSGFNIVIGYGANQRLAVMPRQQVVNQLYQSIAHGSFPVFAVTGTFKQQDRDGLEGAREVFTWHKNNDDLYVEQKSAARVLVLNPDRNRDFVIGVRADEQSQRGLIRILSEKHIPFVITDNARALLERPGDFDLVIRAAGSTIDVEPYLSQGGRVIYLGDPPPSGLPAPVKEWKDFRSSYFRIHDRKLFPSTTTADIAVVQGRYLEFPPEPRPLLTFIPPHLEEMAETAQLDMVETTKPGVLLRDQGKGRFAYVPWDVTGIYYRQGFPVHSDIVSDLIDHMSAGRRQLVTTAHPLVETVLMRQPARNRTLVHLVNNSGQMQINYAPPLPMTDIEVSVAGQFASAHSRVLKAALPVRTAGGYTRFVLPRLNAYDAVVLS